ncbi:disease resistance protein Roq1-like [Prosopis cineraria]|uniref:disease resistance protein Roq1-like n=1 Tax=Prosopis cineraria TaxID=364024 RepID=UPI002410218A|nr:disease resistance protein Roq1-like [Prosopis cineraria]
MEQQAGSSSITYKWTYDVFISFHGEDTRLGFIGHLREALRQRGIHVFKDDEGIRTGEGITAALFKAIGESRVAIIVFSKKYANSTFCLEELSKILECFKEEGRLIYPVFYYVDPSELRRPRRSYAKALVRLEERFKDNKEKVQKWRLALSLAAELKGCHLKPKIANEQEHIAGIVSEVSNRINRNKPLSITDYPVGLVSQAKELISCLKLESTKETKMVGIWGAGGIGKSTIARAVYNLIGDLFEGACFLSNVRKRSKNIGLSHLQETLLDQLVMEKNLKLGDIHEGIPIIKYRLSQKKILLILDDIDEFEQLKALAKSCDWFGLGSRIVITTRNKQLLVSHGIDSESIYDVKELNYEESLQLLNWHAFKNENVDSNYLEVCNRAIHYSCGFPLALEVIGSNLCGKGVDEWNDALDQFKAIPYKGVLEAVQLSYNALEEFEKKKNSLIWSVSSMIKGDCVIMHDLIEDMGKEIVRHESQDEPGERSRLWFHRDILQVLQHDTETNKVEAIVLDLPQGKEVQWSGNAFMKMKKLKMLVIKNARFSKGPTYLPNSLRWLEWK